MKTVLHPKNFKGKISIKKERSKNRQKIAKFSLLTGNLFNQMLFHDFKN